MAIRFNASGEYLTRTASLPSTTAFTITGWAYRASAPAKSYFANFENKAWPTDSTQYLGIGYDPSDNFQIYSTTAPGNFATNYGNNVWFFFALACGATGAGNLKGYAGRATDASLQTATTTGVSFTPLSVLLGNTTYDEHFDGRLAAIKIWDAALSQAEIEQERWTYLPRRLANLHGFWPMIDVVVANNNNDFSGNGKTLTAGGTLSVEDGPPISWGKRRRLAV